MASSPQWLVVAADLLLGLHVLVVLFVVLGLILTLTGGWRGWQWIRNLWFRLAHLLVIAVVLLQSWLGMVCPLTTWEMALRDKAGDVTYPGQFVSHWMSEFLYVDAPWWMFVLAYSLFGLLVAWSWLRFPPRRFGRTSA